MSYLVEVILFELKENVTKENFVCIERFLTKII